MVVFSVLGLLMLLLAVAAWWIVLRRKFDMCKYLPVAVASMTVVGRGRRWADVTVLE